MSDVLINCPNCTKNLRFPSNKVIKFNCPQCKSLIYADNGVLLMDILEVIFSRSLGWDFSQKEIPIYKKKALTGEVYYEISVETLIINTFLMEKGGNLFIVCQTELTDFQFKDIKNCLMQNTNVGSIPSLGITTQGNPTIQMAIPIFENEGYEIFRNQVLVCLSTIAIDALDIMKQRNSANGTTDDGWEIANKIATLAGKLIRGIID